jgi:uncharacterized Zn finger protein
VAWGDRFPAYVPVEQRLERGKKEADKRLKKAGRAAAPVRIEGRGKVLTKTFWGSSWCQNLERYSDIANRLERGRTYARNGSVVDLHIEPGVIHAFVSGSDLYTVKIVIEPLASERWQALVKECAGKIASLVGLLKGELSGDVLAVLTRQNTGLFPEPKEIDLDCSCPDGAYLCKHLAAVLYGVGARLDGQPELFFTLRRVDQAELLAGANVGAVLAKASAGSGKKRVDSAKLGGIFGIDLAGEEEPMPIEDEGTKAKSKTKAKAKGTAKATKPAKPRKPAAATSPKGKTRGA